MLKDEQIMRLLQSRSTYYRGLDYVMQGRVGELDFNVDRYLFKATVEGEDDYDVVVEFDDDLSIKSYDCDCAAYAKYEGACKHVVAVLKKIQHHWNEYFGANNPLKLHESVRRLMTFFAKQHGEDDVAVEKVQTAALIPTLNSFHSSDIYLTFMIGAEKLYVLKDTRRFIEAYVQGNEIIYGKNFTYRPKSTRFDEASQTLLDMMVAQYYDERPKISYYSTLASFSDKRFMLNRSGLTKFLELMVDGCFSACLGNVRDIRTRVVAGRPPVSLKVEATEHGLKASLTPRADSYYIVDPEATLVYYDGLMYRVDKRFSDYVNALQQCFSKSSDVVVPHAYAPQFLGTVAAAVEGIGKVVLDESMSTRFYREPLAAQVYLDRHNEGIEVTAKFKYGEHVFDPFNPQPQASPVVDGKALLRSSSDEAKVLELLKHYGFRQVHGAMLLEDEEASFEFLQKGLPELAEFAEVFCYEGFRPIVKSPGRVSAGLKLNTDKGLLEMTLQYDMQPQELVELLSSYKVKRRYHKLKDGTFMSLESAEFRSAAQLIEQLGLTSAELENKALELPKYRAMYIDSLTRDLEGLRLERNSAFRKMVQDLREPQDVEFVVPQTLKGTLREYQVAGFRWLKTLASYGFGGILADDMGLGKTLQVISVVLSDKVKGGPPSLVVAPTSLVYNWEAEVRKFAPELNVVVIAGQPGERKERVKEINSADLVVTSYGLIKRDIERYATTQFRYCFVDEAQNIKNPATLNAKAVKQIRAHGYFALTGTPIENNLTELWSIFDFLMPGYLLSHHKFSAKFESPIVKHGDKNALEELARHIRPFVLRRMKRDVLKELPPKVESKLVCEMSPEQAKLYQAYMLRAKREYEDEVAEHGFDSSRIKILALLTRLRQLCCHPGMFLEGYTGGSGKLEAMLELVRDALAGGHRILVFSQFTTMLEQVGVALKASGIDYHYLDGSTLPEERMRLVNAFNAGGKPVFLLSLKAGGTGLNLTGADMVIHLDPWWNPAVEDQATDRAYRIGQGNSVQVYKLIARNTIEERIYELQQAKKELIDAVIKPGESFLTKMNEEEIRRLFHVV